ncbi:sensor histidine kinase [Hydrotalea flava]|uniref:sensor histidine kinase n=1 Tax=Hydrotalea flava TaxID=714549 RepID=UPI00142ECFBD|nr:sensor histidine kinase [Hydrotalea flava]
MLPYIFAPQPKDIPQQVSRYIITLFITINLFLLVFYYLNTLLFIPKLLFKKQWIIYILLIAICLYGFLNLPRQLALWMNNTTETKIRTELRRDLKKADSLNFNIQQKGVGDKNSTPAPSIPKRRSSRYFPGSYAVFLLVFAVGTSISVLQQWLKVERTKEKIEKEMLQTELSFLKSQINPHFFFNTLNNIYSLSITGSDQTPSAILKLSAIMRYILAETKNDWVPLQNEIDFLNDYIDLQKVRLTQSVALTFTVNGNISNQRVAPLIFIPFVENAFKYGVSTIEPSFIHINIAIQNNTIIFSVKNSIVSNAGNSLTETTGIGIKNVERRLTLLYPAKHELKIKNEKNIFSVELTLVQVV